MHLDAVGCSWIGAQRARNQGMPSHIPGNKYIFNSRCWVSRQGTLVQSDVKPGHTRTVPVPPRDNDNDSDNDKDKDNDNDNDNDKNTDKNKYLHTWAGIHLCVILAQMVANLPHGCMN